jgi:hypothetical protein
MKQVMPLKRQFWPQKMQKMKEGEGSRDPRGREGRFNSLLPWLHERKGGD